MFYESLITVVGKISNFTYFVGSVQGFPKPLSKEDEQKLLDELAKGSKEARDKLITHNLRLVSHIVKKFTGALEVDDLISIGTIGLIKAIDTFKSDKKVQLGTYASRCIENEILMAIRASKKHNCTISYNTILPGNSKGDELELFEVICDPESDEVFDEVDRNCFIKQVQEIAEKCLDIREREILVLRFGLNGKDCLTQKEVADKLGISRSYVSRIESRALAIIKNKMPKDEKYL